MEQVIYTLRWLKVIYTASKGRLTYPETEKLTYTAQKIGKTTQRRISKLCTVAIEYIEKEKVTDAVENE